MCIHGAHRRKPQHPKKHTGYQPRHTLYKPFSCYSLRHAPSITNTHTASKQKKKLFQTNIYRAHARIELDATVELCHIHSEMKLLISLTDQSFAATKSVGIFNVSMGLVRGLMQCAQIKELHILGNNECATAFTDAPVHVHLHEMHRPVPKRFQRVWWDQIELSQVIRRIRPDWALLPKGFPPFFPRLGQTKLACYLHDVNWEYYESAKHSAISPFPKHELIYFRTLSKRALSKADLILTSTQFNRQRYLSYEPSANVAVVGIGFDAPCSAPICAGKDILFYASPYPHKLTTLGIRRLSAWLNQQEAAQNIRIHLIGSLPPNTILPDNRWIQHGRIPHEKLQQLMHTNCRLSVYFSDYEGFGMPPVESLRAGLPCIASNLPPIRENIPPQYLFDNDDEASFISKMNAAYSTTTAPVCPQYPNWQQVAERVVSALQLPPPRHQR